MATEKKIGKRKTTSPVASTVLPQPTTTAHRHHPLKSFPDLFHAKPSPRPASLSSTLLLALPSLSLATSSFRQISSSFGPQPAAWPQSCKRAPAPSYLSTVTKLCDSPLLSGHERNTASPPAAHCHCATGWPSRAAVLSWRRSPWPSSSTAAAAAAAASHPAQSWPRSTSQR